MEFRSLASLAGSLRSPRPPFPAAGTVAVTALLVLVPSLWLTRHPRPQAKGLERVLSAAALLQSFPADPRRGAPELWLQRLGQESSRRLWRYQRGTWWQFWGRHGDGGLYLVLSASSFKAAAVPLPAGSMRVDDLVVLAPDPLAAALLKEPLALKQRRPRGLEQRCVSQLLSQQAVYWTDAALGQMLGPLSSLVQRFQQGCLELTGHGETLTWQGETASAPALASRPPAPVPIQQPPSRLAGDGLLELRGERLEFLLGDLLNRQIIREPLSSRYGIGDRQRALLRRTPFLLRLKPLEKGPFQASLELQLMVGAKRSEWAALLAPLRQALLDQGLVESSSRRPVSSPSVLPTSSWERDDRTVVGGWRWVNPATAGEPQLLFFLGPDPSIAGSTAPWPDARAQGRAAMELLARPSALAAQGLLPGDLPALVQRAERLSLFSGAGSAGSNGLSGSLQLPSQPR
ncbi:hypothetical protein [Cyanobium sp. Morenito 9A2]|uniref:hypothetical protein n=1 Tax=Cyanobium sp. Morenito 9A2 TaxID=2823718 RepID=UPI0020CE9925|nr:hypothetical protein [Cyanobium sp. Morenito 9A2]MCP9850133.1 hypothetical protein [Cyanobium sp. Morenito 9A2]